MKFIQYNMELYSLEFGHIFMNMDKGTDTLS